MASALTVAKTSAGFSILLMLDGDGSLKTTNSGSIAVGHGDALVIPWSAGDWSLNGGVGIVCRPPLPAAAALAP